LKPFGTDVRPRKALGICRTEKAIDEHRLTIDEVQKMASVADLKEQVILQVFLLGLRITDAITLKVNDLNKLEQSAPIDLNLRATKESTGTVYEMHAFLGLVRCALLRNTYASKMMHQDLSEFVRSIHDKHQTYNIERCSRTPRYECKMSQKRNVVLYLD